MNTQLDEISKLWEQAIGAGIDKREPPKQDFNMGIFDPNLMYFSRTLPDGSTKSAFITVHRDTYKKI
ncbi:hypothetical protein ACFLZ7_01490 [Nanoarchaeota archaeon]